MGKMLSMDTRERLMQAYESGKKAEEIAHYYDVHVSTIRRIAKLKKETGTVKPLTERCGRKALLSEENIRDIDRLIEEQNDITVHEIRVKLNLPVSDETVRRAVVRLGHRYKKKR